METIEKSVIEINDILTKHSNILKMVDEVRSESISEEETLTGKFSSIIGISAQNSKTWEPHNSSDQSIQHGGYRDTQLFTSTIKIDVLSSKGKNDAYCRNIGAYIQQYLIDHHEILKPDYRLFMEAATLSVSPGDRAGRWKAQILIECVMYKAI